AAALRGHAAEADIGLHLNLTHGTPLGPMPAFAPAGRFPDPGKVLKAALKRQLPETEIRQEFERQIDAFQRHFGTPPAFADGHHHVQILAQIRPLLFECLEKKGLAGKIWLRDSSDKLHRIAARGLPDLKKALAVSWLAKGFARDAAAHGFFTNDGFSGFSAFRADENYAACFARYLRAPGPRHLIMCHPGYRGDEAGSPDPIAISREHELGFLLSPSFPALLAQRGARLARLSEAFGLSRTEIFMGPEGRAAP
ncbi:MAG TPA: ChbG/HpnK family deacetylase, partial [Methylocella sp.]|nr:ChbG/HpnK family deacetylase [Methylocella sp.]